MTSYLIIGGGVAGVACFEELCRVCENGDKITLLSATSTVKSASLTERVGRMIEKLDLVERPLFSLEDLSGSTHSINATLRVVLGEVVRVDTQSRTVYAVSSDASVSPIALSYDKLCLCTGASPREPHPGFFEHPLMLGIRDNGSLATLQRVLSCSRRALLVGNGGIALGLLSQLHALPSTCDIHWVVREDYFGATFLGASASDFLLAASPTCIEFLDLQLAAASLSADLPAPTECASFPFSTAIDDKFAPTSLFSHGAPGGAPGVALQCAPLPRRERQPGGERHKKRLKLPPTSVTSNSSATMAEPVSLAKSLEASVTEAGCWRPLTSPTQTEEKEVHPFPPPMQTLPKWGASLGPHWAELLNGGAASPSAQDSSTPRIHVRRRSVVTAVRGEFCTQGDFGPLKGGGWVSLGPSLLAPKPAPLKTAESGDSPPSPPFPLQVHLECSVTPAVHGSSSGVGSSQSRIEGYDAIIWTLGVAPNTSTLPLSLLRHPDGGLIVNPSMQTSDRDVYAAGDCTTMLWPRAQAIERGDLPLWFQLRTWTQAWTAGAYAARCMAGVTGASLEAGDGGIAYQCFSHTTSIQGFKTVLLGIFNAQGLGEAWERAVRCARTTSLASRVQQQQQQHPLHAMHTLASPWGKVHLLIRATPGVEYVQVIVVGGRVVGAMLLGDTDLEETMENLILNGTDVRVKSRNGGGVEQRVVVRRETWRARSTCWTFLIQSWTLRTILIKERKPKRFLISIRACPHTIYFLLEPGPPLRRCSRF